MTGQPALRMTVPLAVVLLLIALVMLLISSAYGNGSDSLRVSYINVGQGDSIWLHASDLDQTDILIDGGLPGAGPTVVAYLQNNNIDDIDVMVLSHDDADHVDGLIDVLSSTIPVRAIIYNGQPYSSATYLEFVGAMQAHNLTPTPAVVGQSYSWGPISSTVLNPQVVPAGTQNEDSVVLLMSFGSSRFLFPGDIDSGIEQVIVNSGTPITADVLKVAHHGSRYSSSASFLDAVKPKAAVISVGTNHYGHPAPETLDRLAAVGAIVYRTDITGTVVITSDGQSVYYPGLHYVFLPVVIREPIPALPSDLHITALSGLSAPEYVTVQNSGAGTQDMTGWYLISVVGPQRFNFPVGYTLAPGATVRIESYTGAVNNPPSILLWSTGAIWSNTGDKAVLYDNAGQAIDSACYGNACL